MTYRLGIDVGGTFTDFLLADEAGRFTVHKSPTTPADPSAGLLDGVRDLAEMMGLGLTDFLARLELIVHGTTVTTNAVLTDRGARTGLLTTAGFRDALAMRRGIREVQYDNRYTAPAPLVPRYLRLPARERMDVQGAVQQELDEDDVRQAAGRFRQQGVEALAICFLHAYANAAHEQRAVQILAEELPGVYLSTSAELLPQVRFYDRVSTTTLNAYVGPILRRYLQRLVERLDGLGFQGVLLIMQSSGGVTAPESVIRAPANTLLSGPAAGPVAGLVYAGAQGHDRCITVDMGGTSFDAALIQDGRPLTVAEGEIGRRRLALPMLGIHTIGAGGGSLGWLDAGGLLHMGPGSAGADPGPACYDRGGTLPTCTDADLVLGYLNPDYFLGGRMRLRADLARRAIETHLARPLGLTVEEAAAGMYRLINVNMAAGIQEVSVKRGFDPRDFPLVVAGGAGPVHAGTIAGELGIGLVIVPRQSSIFCAAGMLLSDLRHEYVRTYHGPWDRVDERRVSAHFAEMEAEGRATLAHEQVPEDRLRFVRSCDLRYRGQYAEVTIEMGPGEGRDAVAERFHATHDRMYGYRLDGTPLELVNLRVAATGLTHKPRFGGQQRRDPNPAPAWKGRRSIFSPDEGRFIEVDVFDGDSLGYGQRLRGPAVVEQITTTVIVPPGYDLICDRYGSYTLLLRERSAELAASVLGE